MQRVFQATSRGFHACCALGSVRRRQPYRKLFQSRIVCESTGNDSKLQSEPVKHAVRPPNTRRPPPPPGFNPNLKVERVENLDENAWAGVAAIDKGEPEIDWKKRAILVGGDLFMLMLFAAIGRYNHGEPLTVAAVLETAGPLILGVLLTSPLTGAYSGKDDTVGSSAVTAIKTWGLGILAGVLIRSVVRGYLPDKSFVIVGMAVNFVLLVGWRSAFAAGMPKDTVNNKSELQRRKDKKGNPCEFFQLLTSLVKRW